MGNYSPPKRSNRWTAIIFIPTIMILGFVGAPLYIWQRGITASEIYLFLFFYLATGFSITVGYHRLFSHASFKTNAFIRFLLLFFGASTFEKSALRWASQHRQHHAFTDTDLDPHNSKRGWLFCHAGWIMFYKHNVNFNNVKDLSKSRLIRHQHQYYDYWSVVGGILLPMALGLAIGKPLGAFLVAVCLRLALVMNAAFLINSYAHMVGSKRYNEKASASDHWLGAFLTNGEGYHSFHHRYPSDYRNGHRWFHWDPSKWLIYSLSVIGMTSQLRRVAPKGAA